MILEKKHRKISCNDFFYSDKKRTQRLSMWRNELGAHAVFTYSLGSQDTIIVTIQEPLNGERQKLVLTKV